LSDKETKTGGSPSEKIEQLIGEAKRMQTNAGAAVTGAAESKERKASEKMRAEGEGPIQERELKEDILATLKGTKEELSWIIGLLDEKEIVTPASQTLPKYCSYCGRGLLPNAFYCDRCGTTVRGV